MIPRSQYHAFHFNPSPLKIDQKANPLTRSLQIIQTLGGMFPHQAAAAILGHRYQVTEAGRAILLTVLTTARTSLYELNRVAKAA